MNLKNNSPRMELWGDHLTRTFRICDLSEGMKGRGAKVCALLSDCFPEGTNRDTVGATSKQIAYIFTLANLKGKSADEFFSIVSFSGGISSYQAHYLIQQIREGT